jgi:chromosome partitioning protein
VKYILVPVETHHMAVDGLAQLMKTFNVIKRRLNPGLAIYGILPCRVVYRTTSANEVIENLKAAFGDLVFKSTIRENVRLAVAPSHKKPITSFDPSSNGAIDYRATAKEFLTRSEKQGRA